MSLIAQGVDQRRGQVLAADWRLFALAVVASVMAAHEASAHDQPTNPGRTDNTVELLSYQATGYRFRILEADESPPTDFEKPGFDDSAFQVGNAALRHSEWRLPFAVHGARALGNELAAYREAKGQSPIRRKWSTSAGLGGQRHHEGVLERSTDRKRHHS